MAAADFLSFAVFLCALRKSFEKNKQSACFVLYGVDFILTEVNGFLNKNL